MSLEAVATTLRWPLTDVEIDALAGRELDAYVEQVVFGNAITGYAPVYSYHDCIGDYVTEPDSSSVELAGVYLEGCICEECPERRDTLGHTCDCFEVAGRYSSEWGLLEKLLPVLAEHGFSWDGCAHCPGDDCHAQFWRSTNDLRRPHVSRGASVPEATCRAALKSMRDKDCACGKPSEFAQDGVSLCLDCLSAQNAK